MADFFRDKLRSFLQVQPAVQQSFHIIEELDFNGNAIANKLWYRGNASELNQFYRQVNSDTCPFWGSIPTRGLEVRKIHTGLPKIIVNTLTNIVIRDLNDIKYTDVKKNEIWGAIANENDFTHLIAKALTDTMVIGDGALKVSFDPSISEYPILEWVAGDKVDFKYKKGRLESIKFKTEMPDGYTLVEKYGKGYIIYKLYRNGTECPLVDCKQTTNLQDIAFDPSFSLAVPFKIYDSERYEGRGQSLFDGKKDNFDALDETWSQWIHAERTTRPVKYVPESLIPRDERNGRLLKPNPFDNQFIATESSMLEGAKNEISILQADFPSDAYNATFITALDLALQGLISPSTLGIDVKKLDNAEAQREKEKATLYTRGILVEHLTEFIKRVCDVVFKAYNTAHLMPLEDTETDVTFGEYASPSFDSVLDALSNPNSPMSIEARVEELYGDTKSEEWKREEVSRIKAQMGIIEMEEPVVGAMPEESTDIIESAKEETGKTLNGAQTASLLSVMAQYTAGTLSEGQAIAVISTSIGVTKEEAQNILRGA